MTDLIQFEMHPTLKLQEFMDSISAMTLAEQLMVLDDAEIRVLFDGPIYLWREDRRSATWWRHKDLGRFFDLPMDYMDNFTEILPGSYIFVCDYFKFADWRHYINSLTMKVIQPVYENTTDDAEHEWNNIEWPAWIDEQITEDSSDSNLNPTALSKAPVYKSPSKDRFRATLKKLFQ